MLSAKAKFLKKIKCNPLQEALISSYSYRIFLLDFMNSLQHSFDRSDKYNRVVKADWCMYAKYYQSKDGIEVTIRNTPHFYTPFAFNDDKPISWQYLIERKTSLTFKEFRQKLYDFFNKFDEDNKIFKESFQDFHLIRPPKSWKFEDYDWTNESRIERDERLLNESIELQKHYEALIEEDEVVDEDEDNIELDVFSTLINEVVDEFKSDENEYKNSQREFSINYQKDIQKELKTKINKAKRWIEMLNNWNDWNVYNNYFYENLDKIEMFDDYQKERVLERLKLFAKYKIPHIIWFDRSKLPISDFSVLIKYKYLWVEKINNEYQIVEDYTYWQWNPTNYVNDRPKYSNWFLKKGIYFVEERIDNDVEDWMIVEGLFDAITPSKRNTLFVNSVLHHQSAMILSYMNNHIDDFKKMTYLKDNDSTTDWAKVLPANSNIKLDTVYMNVLKKYYQKDLNDLYMLKIKKESETKNNEFNKKIIN